MEGINKICKHRAACNSIDHDEMQPFWLDLILLLVMIALHENIIKHNDSTCVTCNVNVNENDFMCIYFFYVEF